MTSITFRVDNNLKRDFDSLCEQFGISTTAAFNIYMKTVVRDRKIPFEIKADSVTDIRTKGLDAFMRMRTAAERNGLQDISLEEINSIISEVRNGR